MSVTNRMKEALKRWSQAWNSNEANDVDAVRQAVASVYARLNRPVPHVVWCDSPWQLALVPFLMELACFSPGGSQKQFDERHFQRVWREKLDTSLDQPLWRQSYRCVMAHLSNNDLEQAIKNSKRIAHDGPTVGEAITARLIYLKREADYRRQPVLDTPDIDFTFPARARRALERTLQADTDIVVSALGVVSLFSKRAKMRMVCELQEQLREPFRQYFSSLLELESLVDRQWNGSRRPTLLPSGADDFPRRNRAPLDSPHLNKLVETAVNKFTREGGDLRAQFCRADEILAGRKIAPVEQYLARTYTTYELVWGNWALEVIELVELWLQSDQQCERRHEEMPIVQLQELEEYLTLCRGAFMYVFDEEIVYACRNPVAIHCNNQGIFHSDDRPAIEFLDGYCGFFWHGVPVKQELVRNPSLITVAAIEEEPNLEVKRVMIERYGLSNYILESGAQVIARDDVGVLYRKTIAGEEAIQLVMVKNSTAELDGSYKDYFLRVPPNVRTPRQGIAWTFNMRTEEYQPTIQT